MPTDISRPVVLVLIKGLGIGGAEKLVAEGARHWDRESFDYRVAYMLPWKDQLVGQLDELGVGVECVGGDRGGMRAAGRRLNRLIREMGAELVHAHLPSAGILARLFSPAPVVYTEHNLAWTYRVATRVLNRATYGRNAAVTAVSQAVADSVARYPGPEVETVPNGVTPFSDPYGARRARRELGLGHHDPLVVHVGNIRPGKGHALLIEVARELLDLRPDVTVVSIGAEKFPGGLAALRQKADAMGLADRMIFLGRRSDARDFIATADVYVNPADFEGLPVTILEAMAASRPVVATAVGGVPSVIEDGVTGRLVAPGSASELVKAIDALLEDRERAERMGRAAEAIVNERFGLEPMIRSFERIYSRVLG